MGDVIIIRWSLTRIISPTAKFENTILIIKRKPSDVNLKKNIALDNTRVIHLTESRWLNIRIWQKKMNMTKKIDHDEPKLLNMTKNICCDKIYLFKFNVCRCSVAYYSWLMFVVVVIFWSYSSIFWPSSNVNVCRCEISVKFQC